MNFNLELIKGSWVLEGVTNCSGEELGIGIKAANVEGFARVTRRCQLDAVHVLV